MFVEKEVEFQLGNMSRLFENGDVKECDVGSSDETNFIINVENSETLQFRGEDEVKFEDVVSGGEIISVIVSFTCGCDAHISPVLF